MPRSSKRPRSVTLADVARFAGVSTAVVSYVVNNGPRPVAPETAERVREAIEFLGYRPNTQARALSTGSTGTIGVIHQGTANPFFGEFNDIVYEAASDAGVALLTANSAGRPETEFELIERLAGRNVDGIISMTCLAREDVSILRSPGVPLLFVNCPFAIPGFRTMGPDSAAGATEVVLHMLKTHRHPEVALIAGRASSAEPDDREVGWREAHRLHGAQLGPVVRARYTPDGGYEAAAQLLSRPRVPTAIFVGSDIQAIGVLHAIHDRGLDVPGQIAVVSFDGISEAAHTWPPLTLVRQPVRSMASAAVKFILDGSTDEGANNHTLFQTDLIIRRSCGCSHPTTEPDDT